MDCNPKGSMCSLAPHTSAYNPFPIPIGIFCRCPGLCPSPFSTLYFYIILPGSNSLLKILKTPLSPWLHWPLFSFYFTDHNANLCHSIIRGNKKDLELEEIWGHYWKKNQRLSSLYINASILPLATSIIMTKGVWKTWKHFKEQGSPPISQNKCYFSEIVYVLHYVILMDCSSPQCSVHILNNSSFSVIIHCIFVFSPNVKTPQGQEMFYSSLSIHNRCSEMSI